MIVDQSIGQIGTDMPPEAVADTTSTCSCMPGIRRPARSGHAVADGTTAPRWMNGHCGRPWFPPRGVPLIRRGEAGVRPVVRLGVCRRVHSVFALPAAVRFI